jgi:TonB family protein
VRKNFVIPEIVLKKRITGKVIIQIYISKTGDVLNVKLITSLNPDVDKEALRVVSIPKKWSPAKRHGKTIPFKLNIPIHI